MNKNYILALIFIIPASYHEVALPEVVGDWIVSGDDVYRGAFTAARGSHLGGGSLSYTCVKNDAGCFYRLSIIESCFEGEEITLLINTDILQHETKSICTYMFSKAGDKASLKFKTLGEIGEQLSTSSKISIKSHGRPIAIEYQASLIGASQAMFYVNGIFAE